jgi:Bacterial capsule synthesis protein PGA_cap
MVGSSRPRHYGRPPKRVLLVRWLGVLAVLAAIVAAVVLTVGAVAGGSGPKRAAGGGGSTPATTSGPAPRAGAPPATTATPVPAAPVTISAVGDAELGDTPQLPPDPATYLDPVRAALAAQIVFGNLEGTLTDSAGSKCGAGSTDCFAFRTPPGYAQYLRQAGFTVLNSANNHSHDFGPQGVSDTSAALATAGIVQAGLPGQIGVVHAGTTTVAFVDFAPYPTTNNLLDLATARALTREARREADIVVVYMHAGAEGSEADHVTGREEFYLGEDRGNAEAFAHAAIDDGASLVIASGPHVLRGIEFYKGDLIAYSLGNFAGYQNFGTGGTLSLSGILKVTLDGKGRFVSGTFVSLLLDGDGRPSVDPTGAAARFVAQLSTEDFGADAAVFNPSAAISPPTSTG